MKQARKTWGFVIDAPVADAPVDRDIRIVRRFIFCEPLRRRLSKPDQPVS
jgi:hypothetical protein